MGLIYSALGASAFHLQRLPGILEGGKGAGAPSFPPTSGATLVVQDSGREGAPGGCPPGQECQLYNIRKGAEKSHCLCSHCTKGKERRKTLECIPAAARKQSHSGHRGPAFRAVHLHRQMPQRLPHWRPHRLRCTQPHPRSQLSLCLTSDLCGSTSSVSM